MIYVIIFLLSAIYFLPLVIYRHIVRKAPVEAKRAKNIIKLYALILLTALSLLFRSPIHMGIIWLGIIMISYVNYKVLIGGKLKPDTTVKVDEAQNFEIVYEDLNYVVSDACGDESKENQKS